MFMRLIGAACRGFGALSFNVTATKQWSATAEIITSQLAIKLLFVVSATSVRVRDVSVVLVGCDKLREI